MLEILIQRENKQLRLSHCLSAHGAGRLPQLEKPRINLDPITNSQVINVKRSLLPMGRVASAESYHAICARAVIFPHYSLSSLPEKPLPNVVTPEVTPSLVCFPGQNSREWMFQPRLVEGCNAFSFACSLCF